MNKRIIALLISLILALSVLPSVNVGAEEEPFSASFEITEVNGKRVAVSVIVYTEAYGEKTGTTGSGAEFAVSSENKVIAEGKKNIEIPKGGFVVSFGPAKANGLPDINVGDTVLFDEAYNSVIIISKTYSPFNESVLEYNGINATRAENKLIIYRDRATTGTNTWGYEAVVDSSGVIVSVGGNNSAIPEGGFVISGVGNKKQPIIDACKLGYTAVLDEALKTVTVSYTKENAISSYELRLKEMEEKLENATVNFSDIDYKKAEESLESLDLLVSDIKKALDSDGISEFIKLGYAFDREIEEMSSALVPYAPVEARTLWLRIAESANLSTVEKTVKDIYEMGFNSVCIELLFNSTTIMPMPEKSLFEQNPAFQGQDMLKLYTDKLHEYGIEVHAWMSCYRVGHDGSSNVNLSVGKKKPEWLNIDQNGKESVTNEYGNAYFLNPALPEVQEFILESYKYILENYAIDGFQLDYVRYPENSAVNYGYDEYTKSKFLEKHKNIKAVPTSSAQAGWEEWCKFRADFVTELVRKTGALIKEIRPDVLFSCDVAPGYETTKIKMCQDTETWLKEGLVDVIYPMAYGTTDAVIKWANNTVELSGDGIQAVIGLRDNGPEIYREQVVASRECGAEGTAFFSYSQYVAGNYKNYIKDSVFSKDAVCPSYNAKNAVIAQLDHISKTINERILSILKDRGSSIDTEALKTFSENITQFNKKLADKSLSQMNNDLSALFAEGNALAESYASESDALSDNVCKYLTKALRIAEKAAKNSHDDEKAAYLESLNTENGDTTETTEGGDSSDTSVESNAQQTTEASAFEKVFQILFMIIMSVGLLGLPAFYWLNSRKRRLLKEFEEGNGNSDDGIEEEPEDTENKE